MSVLPLSIARVSNLLQTSTATQNIDGTQAELIQLEQELSTGKAVNAQVITPRPRSSFSNSRKHSATALSIPATLLRQAAN